MKYDCALDNGPLGCSTDEQGKKTCTCDTDLCNIGMLLPHSTSAFIFIPNSASFLISSQGLKWNARSAKARPQRSNFVCLKSRSAEKVKSNKA